MRTIAVGVIANPYFALSYGSTVATLLPYLQVFLRYFAFLYVRMSMMRKCSKGDGFTYEEVFS